MNHKSDKPENLEPQDSKQKKITHPQDDNETVVKKSDRTYNKQDADFGNTAEKKENSEQPGNPQPPSPEDN